MRTTFEDEDELAPQQSQPDRELTLSSTTLLAIFFGLVLICGLFFGLGYTLGRHSPSESAIAQNGPDAVQAASSPAAPQPSVILPKPSAASQPTVVAAPTPVPEDAQSSDADSGTPDPTPIDKPIDKPVVKPAMKTPEAVTPQPAQPKPLQSKPTVQPAISSTPQPATTSTSGVMVQIAAVSNAADADVLVKALQKHGYSAAVRREPNDNFLHVQVGPFASRSEANTMRQKLQNDGYNAILK